MLRMLKTKQFWVIAMVGLGFMYGQEETFATQTVGVFIALCDNQAQGIAPVPARIGDGLKPEENLYWGCTEGLASVFGHSRNWQLTARTDRPTTASILRERHYRHRSREITLHAFAYRGDCIRQCLAEYERAVCRGEYDLAVYIGHNGLMDFELPVAPAAANPATRAHPTECIVLCCKSDEYFRQRLKRIGGRPVLLTTQFMYPGAFILEAVLEVWPENRHGFAMREAAAQAYARNQGITLRAARGVFVTPEVDADARPYEAESDGF